MATDTRYTITLTSSNPLTLPNPRVVFRPNDETAIADAERLLRHHGIVWGDQAVYDGWRLRKSVPGNRDGALVAEVRPGYDSRTAKADRASNPDQPPF